MANEQNLKPFKKGDPRINRKGRPKSFDQIRELVQTIGNEPAVDKDGQPLINKVTGKQYTRLEIMLRAMFTDRHHFETILEYAFGKPARNIDLTSDGRPISSPTIYLPMVDESDRSESNT